MKITKIILLDRLLLLGPPGVGKTEIIYQLAKEESMNLNRKFVDIRNINPKLRESIVNEPQKYYLYMRIVAPHLFPEDINFPVKENVGDTTVIGFYPPRDIYLFTLPKIYGVIFLDEITNVTREDQLAMYYSFVLEKELGINIRLSPNIKIIAAGNPPEYSYIVNPPPAAFLSRFFVVNVGPSSIDEWYKYMERTYGEEWEKRIYVYLKIFPGDFLATPEHIKEFNNFPCPRSWTELSRTLYEYGEQIFKSRALLTELCVGKVGPSVGGKVVAFITKRIPKPTIVFNNPTILDDLDVESTYLSLWACANNRKIVERCGKLIKYLYRTNRDLLVLFVLLIPDRVTRRNLIAEYIDYYLPLAKDIEKLLDLRVSSAR